MVAILMMAGGILMMIGALVLVMVTAAKPNSYIIVDKTPDGINWKPFADPLIPTPTPTPTIKIGRNVTMTMP